MRASLRAIAIVLVLAGGAWPLAQAPERGVVVAPVGTAGQRVALYSGSYALLVGVNQYDARAAWQNLDSIPNELNDVAAALRESGFATIERLNNPTGDQLRTAVPDFIRKYGYNTGARLLFFFAGHGHTLDNGERGYFLPRDTPDPKTDEPGFRRIAVSMQLVATWAQDLTAKHALFVFDSCFSGSIFRTRSAAVPERISAATAHPARQFLSAGDAFQPVPARSVFTPVFVRGVKGAADYDRDGYVTGKELGAYVTNEVLAYRTGQTPQFGAIRDPRYDQGDLVFAVPAPAAIAPGLDPAIALRDGIARYTAKDYAAAYPLLLRAGTAGQTRAAVYLGYLYEQGLGVTQNLEQARDWYQKGVAAGDIGAMTNLGVLYANGRGGPRDDNAALALYRRAAAGGELFAITNMAGRFERGTGVPLDRATAVNWYKRAAFRGHDPALKALQRLGETAAVEWAAADPGGALKVGLDRFRQGQRAESFDPLLRAASNNLIEATFYLGYLYSNGLGAPVDRQEARVQYEKSAAVGNSMAMNNLGYLYENGFGVPIDYNAARDWYQRSAAAGNSMAMKNLGGIYEDGRGVPKNVATALDWYRKAAALKQEDAIKALARLTPGTTLAATLAPASFDIDSTFTTGNLGTRIGFRGTLTVSGLGIEFREASTVVQRAVNNFTFTCAQIVSVRNETESDGRIALRIEAMGSTYRLYSALNARRALAAVQDACRIR